MLDSLIQALDEFLGKLRAIRDDHQAAQKPAPEVVPVPIVPPAPPAPLAAVPTPAEPAAPAGEFKCPACGATFAEPTLCANQHPAEQTLPAADVLAGAPMTGAPAEPAPAAPEPAAPDPAAPEGTPSTPDWPA